MCIGEERRLTVPPSLGYGKRGVPKGKKGGGPGGKGGGGVEGWGLGVGDEGRGVGYGVGDVANPKPLTLIPLIDSSWIVYSRLDDGPFSIPTARNDGLGRKWAIVETRIDHSSRRDKI
jgi:hypothetical protein